MIKSMMLTLDQDEVRFTPDGKVSVMDMIAALSGSEEPEFIWSEIVSQCPELLVYCEDFEYKDETIKVVDSEGMTMVETYLFDYMIDQWQEAV